MREASLFEAGIVLISVDQPSLIIPYDIFRSFRIKDIPYSVTVFTLKAEIVYPRHI